MLVQVIVDLPTSQVNHPFDYLVPEELQELIKLGMRVEVPFGTRKLMGIVVGFIEESDVEADKLKPISRLLDYESFLNEELIELSKYLADYLQAYWITVLQAMLPNMLKVKYEDYFEVLDVESFYELAGEYIPEKYQGEEKFHRNWLEEKLPTKTIRKLLEEGIVRLEYQVKDQTTQKMVTYIKPLLELSEYKALLEEINKSHTRQIQLLEYIIQKNGESIPWTALRKDLEGFTKAALKPSIEKGWIALEEYEVYRDPYAGRDFKATEAKNLRPQQQAAYDKVADAINEKREEVFLLEGVTGSGKTEIYLQLIALARSKGRGSILLVPEIALTPQMVNQVKSRFQEGVAVLHSGLSTTEKYDEWRRIMTGEATIVVGARSSIFAPIKDLGLIIIDEEHETTYKQNTMPRYHARDVAIWRSNYHSAPLVLGSATPSLESRSRAHVNKYTLLKLDERINQKPLPEVELVDMKEEEVYQPHGEISKLLHEKILDRLNKGEQIVLLLNRRGYSSYVMCRECGQAIDCINCDISLTYHKATNSLNCHYCGYKIRTPKTCPSCHSVHLRPYGLGTQKVEESLQELIPGCRVIRMDVDTTSRKGDHERLLEAFSNHEADILLGTQMIAKGLDFENVTLVGVINADTALNLPDFRAGEKTFQLLTQVAGRAGRGELTGEVIIQTYNPNHYVMRFAKEHDYENFYLYEMRQRHLANYPPYYYTTLVTVSSKKQHESQNLAYEIKNKLRRPELEQDARLIIVGPNQASIARVNEYYYFNILLKYKDKAYVQEQLNEVLFQTQPLEAKGLYVAIDHEPLFFN